jgi:hypothetical protein
VWELHKLGIDIEDIGDDEGYSRKQCKKAVDHVKVDRLLRVATREPSSPLYAAMNGWDFPVSREWIVQADLLDAFLQANSGRRKPKPYPRPWKDNNTNRLGKTTLTPTEARAVLQKNRG